VFAAPGRPRWGPDYTHAFGGEHRVERACERRVSVADQEPEGRGSLTEVHDEVAGLLARDLD
jgi:hypothetical protein